MYTYLIGSFLKKEVSETLNLPYKNIDVVKLKCEAELALTVLTTVLKVNDIQILSVGGKTNTESLEAEQTCLDKYLLKKENGR